MDKEIQEKLQQTKIAIIGGHFTPAMAIKSILEKNGFNNLLWIGSKYSQTQNKNYSLEYLTVKKNNIPFVEIKSGKLWRKVTLKTLIPVLYNTILIPYGFINSIFIIIKYNPKLILSFGGHIALPIVIVAKLFRKKVITHEQTIISGLTNRVIAQFSDIVCISWEDSSQYFPKKKIVYTGLPLREELFDKNIQKYNFNNNLPILLVMGGNQGANTINWRLLEILPTLLQKMNIIHITGNSTITNDYQKSVAFRNNLPDNLKNNYKVVEIADSKKYYSYLNSANMVLSRAGANTVAEILTTGVLSILIPIPWSSNSEQELNAKMVSKIGLGKIVIQHTNLTPDEIYIAIQDVYNHYLEKTGFNKKPLGIVQKSAKLMVPPNASDNIFREIIKLLSR